MNADNVFVTIHVELARWVRPFVIVAMILHLPQRWVENVALRGLKVSERREYSTANQYAFEGTGE